LTFLAGGFTVKVKLPFQPADWPHVPDYQVLEALGGGGMRLVFLARDLKLGRLTAIKVIRPQGLPTPEQLRRFQAECAALARLNHPHIVQIYQSGDIQGQPYYVMEYVKGGSLAQALKDQGPGASSGRRSYSPDLDAEWAHLLCPPRRLVLRRPRSRSSRPIQVVSLLRSGGRGGSAA
jgi:hypothetical protein